MPGVNRRKATTVAAVTVAVMLFQLWMSWHQLHRQISTDESFTYFASNGGVGDLVAAWHSDPAMAVFYVFTFVVSQVTGPSIIALRVLTLVCYLCCVAILCAVALQRGRLWAAAAVAIVLGASPIMREAVVDARAAVMASLVALIAVLVIARVPSDPDPSDRRVAVAVALVSVLAFVHPSGLGPAGMCWLALMWFTRASPVRLRLLAASAAIPLAMAFAATVLQAHGADGLVAPGLSGVRYTLGLLLGGNALLAVVAGAALVIVVVLDGRNERVSTLALASGAGWALALLAAVPIVTLFVARYLVISFLLLALVAVTVTPRSWRTWLFVAVLVAGAAGNLAARDRRPGSVTRWCTVADIIEANQAPGDVVVFPFGSSVTPVMACWGSERTARILSSMETLPSMAGVDRANPRAVWSLALDGPSLAKLAQPRLGRRVLVVRVGENEDRIRAFLSSVKSNGGVCTDDVVQAQGISLCSFPS